MPSEPRRGLSRPSIVLFGLMAALVVGLGAGLLAANRGGERPPPGALDAARGSGRSPGARPPQPIDLNLSDAALPTAEPTALALGAVLYAEHCASCHGARGEGEPGWQVERADGSLPAPPHDASGHTWHHADAELVRIIRHGGTVYMPDSRMPAFGAELNEAEIQAVLGYIKSAFWGPRERLYQAEVSR